jgi:hypothetical protein
MVHPVHLNGTSRLAFWFQALAHWQRTTPQLTTLFLSISSRRKYFYQLAEIIFLFSVALLQCPLCISMYSIATAKKAKQPVNVTKAKQKITASVKKRQRHGMAAAVNLALSQAKDLL